MHLKYLRIPIATICMDIRDQVISRQKQLVGFKGTQGFIREVGLSVDDDDEVIVRITYNDIYKDHIPSLRQDISLRELYESHMKETFKKKNVVIEEVTFAIDKGDMVARCICE